MTSVVLHTACSSIVTYTILADQSDSITITLSGSHQNETYSLNGVEAGFTDTVTVAYNNSLTVSFNVPNSGSSGNFLSSLVTITDNTVSETLTDTIIRENDSQNCNDIGTVVLPSNVAYTDVNNNFSVGQSITGNLEITGKFALNNSTIVELFEVTGTEVGATGGFKYDKIYCLNSAYHQMY